MFKNVASQKLIVYVFDSTTNLPKTGDAANLTAYVSKDYGAVTVLGDTSATEMDATNAKGYYLFDLTQGETNADTLLFSGKSATANMVLVAMPATVFTRPPNFSALSVDSNGRVDVIKVAGTTQTAGDVPAKTNSLTFTGANKVDASVRDWVGDTIPARNVTGVPIIDLKYTLGTISPATAGSVRADQVTAGVSLAASAVQAIWDAATSALTTVGSIGKRLADDIDTTISSRSTLGGTAQTGDSFARLGAPAGASVSADIAAVKSDSAAIKAKTDNLPASPAAVGSAMTLTSGERDSVADALLNRDMSTGTDSGSSSVRTVRQALRFLRNRFRISGATLTVYKEDDSTSSWTSTVTTTAGNPVSESDPA